jgi:peptidoglycan/LPS O-acetylase OafA/YrhL
MMVAQRNNTVDVVRLIAAFGVIALHVKSTTASAEIYNTIFWPLCVPFFYVASLTFFVNSIKAVSIVNQYKKIAKRIVIPYLAWTLIYLSLFFAKGFITGNYSHFVWWKVLFYGESAVQLYFISTLIFLQALALSLYLISQQKTSFRVTGLVLLGLSISYLWIGDRNDCFGVAATGQVLGILFYIATAFYLAPKVSRIVNRPVLAIFGLLLILFAVGSNFLGLKHDILGYSLILPIGGIGLFFFVVGFPGLTLSTTVLALTSASFGIYFSHILFLEAFEFLIEKKFQGHFEYDFWLKTFVTLSVFVCSLILVLTIRQIPVARKILLGEG